MGFQAKFRPAPLYLAVAFLGRNCQPLQVINTRIPVGVEYQEHLLAWMVLLNSGEEIGDSGG